jgi:hypothetical protein
MGLAHGLSDERGGERGVSPNEVRNVNDLEIRLQGGEGGGNGCGEGKCLHNSVADQVNFSLVGNAGSEEGETPIGSIAGVDPKVALAEGAIRQTDDCGEFGSGRKGIQLKEDLTPGGTRGH